MYVVDVNTLVSDEYLTECRLFAREMLRSTDLPYHDVEYMSSERYDSDDIKSLFRNEHEHEHDDRRDNYPIYVDVYRTVIIDCVESTVGDQLLKFVRVAGAMDASTVLHLTRKGVDWVRNNYDTVLRLCYQQFDNNSIVRSEFEVVCVPEYAASVVGGCIDNCSMVPFITALDMYPTLVTSYFQPSRQELEVLRRLKFIPDGYDLQTFFVDLCKVRPLITPQTIIESLGTDDRLRKMHSTNEHRLFLLFLEARDVMFKYANLLAQYRQLH